MCGLNSVFAAPVSCVILCARQAAGRLRKQNTGSSGGFPNYGPTPSPVYAQQHVPRQ